MKIKSYIKNHSQFLFQLLLFIPPSIVFGMREQIATRLNINVWVIIFIYISLQIAGLIYTYNKNKEDAQYKDARGLLINSEEWCEKKYKNMLERIHHVYNYDEDAVDIYSNPEDIIQNILNILEENIYQFFGIINDISTKRDIFIGICYRFPQEDKNEGNWISIVSPGTNKSTKQHDDFINNFRTRNTEDIKYDWDYCSELERTKGSIACYRITLRYINICYIEAVISVLSYKQRFDDLFKRPMSKKKIEDKMQSVLRDLFEATSTIAPKGL